MVSLGLFSVRLFDDVKDGWTEIMQFMWAGTHALTPLLFSSLLAQAVARPFCSTLHPVRSREINGIASAILTSITSRHCYSYVNGEVQKTMVKLLSGNTIHVNPSS